MMEIKPYPSNAKKHPKKQIEQVANSIKEFGMNQPIVVDKQGVIIVGHGRYEALKSLGMEVKDEYVKVVDLTEEQAKAYRLADNKLNESEWDMNLVIEEMKGLSEPMLELTGFDKDLIIEPDEQDDVVPDVPEEPQSKLGDLYELGNHRVLCGDSTKLEDVERLMDGKKADMVFTDPPYNIDFKPQRGTHDKILNDSMDDNSFDLFLDEFLTNALVSMKPDTYAFIFTGWPKLGAFEKALHKVFKVQAFHIWVKNNFGIGYYSRPKHEPFYLCLNGEPIRPQNAPADVWEENKVHKTVHSCEKPVDLITRIVNTYNKNGSILDLFLGSGSTLIASEKTGRICYGMELDPKYIDVIVQRYVDYTSNTEVIKNGEAITWQKSK